MTENNAEKDNHFEKNKKGKIRFNPNLLEVKDEKIKLSQSMVERVFHVIGVLLYILLNLLTHFYVNSVPNNKKYEKLTLYLIVISMLIIILWHAK